MAEGVLQTVKETPGRILSALGQALNFLPEGSRAAGGALGEMKDGNRASWERLSEEKRAKEEAEREEISRLQEIQDAHEGQYLPESEAQAAASPGPGNAQGGKPARKPRNAPLAKLPEPPPDTPTEEIAPGAGQSYLPEGRQESGDTLASEMMKPELPTLPEPTAEEPERRSLLRRLLVSDDEYQAMKEGRHNLYKISNMPWLVNKDVIDAARAEQGKQSALTPLAEQRRMNSMMAQIKKMDDDFTKGRINADEYYSARNEFANVLKENGYPVTVPVNNYNFGLYHSAPMQKKIQGLHEIYGDMKRIQEEGFSEDMMRSVGMKIFMELNNAGAAAADAERRRLMVDLMTHDSKLLLKDNLLNFHKELADIEREASKIKAPAEIRNAIDYVKKANASGNPGNIVEAWANLVSFVFDRTSNFEADLKTALEGAKARYESALNIQQYFFKPDMEKIYNAFNLKAARLRDQIYPELADPVTGRFPKEWLGEHLGTPTPLSKEALDRYNAIPNNFEIGFKRTAIGAMPEMIITKGSGKEEGGGKEKGGGKVKFNPTLFVP
jgi:hypothetical protein